MSSIQSDPPFSEQDLEERFVRGHGPGGQNVNKVATTVQLWFDIDGSSLADDVKHRLRQLGGSRLDQQGRLLIRARRHRTREQNRREARARLAALIDRASSPPKKRKRRRGESRKAAKKRIDAKRRRGALKRDRQKVDD